jgi:hypothetical protein
MTGLYERSTSDEPCAECRVRLALIRCGSAREAAGLRMLEKFR